MITHKNTEFYANGKRSRIACIEVTEYSDGSIIASVEDNKITNAQLRKALKKEYPHYTFYAHNRDGILYAQADPVYDEAIAA